MSKKSENRKFPFGFEKLTRSSYEWRCTMAGYEHLTDDECIDLFAFYNRDIHGSGPETRLHACRGWTLAAPCNVGPLTLARRKLGA